MTLKIDSVSKVYEAGGGSVIHALKDVSFSISAGNIIAVYGPSGSGKSTLLNIVGLLDSCDSGDVYLDEIPYSGMNEISRSKCRRTKFGFIFQNFNLLPELNALENVEMSLILSAVSSSERRCKSLEMLERVGLSDRSNHFPSELSGGQQQRVGIARALVHRPNIILADEPTANLDIRSATLIISMMQEFALEFNTTFLFSTHDPRILAITDRSICLEEGVQKI